MTHEVVGSELDLVDIFRTEDTVATTSEAARTPESPRTRRQLTEEFLAGLSRCVFDEHRGIAQVARKLDHGSSNDTEIPGATQLETLAFPPPSCQGVLRTSSAVS